jgi:hypothetical protein
MRGVVSLDSSDVMMSILKEIRALFVLSTSAHSMKRKERTTKTMPPTLYLPHHPDPSSWLLSLIFGFAQEFLEGQTRQCFCYTAGKKHLSHLIDKVWIPLNWSLFTLGASPRTFLCCLIRSFLGYLDTAYLDLRCFYSLDAGLLK